MDRIAIISDIHGNLPALRATLQDIARRGITQIFCLGDLVGKGPHSDQVVDICRTVCEQTVRGNWDDAMLQATENPMMQWHQQRLGPTRLAYLATLPTTLELVLSGKRVRLFHASHQGIYHRVRMNDTQENQLAMFTNTPFTGSAFEPNVVGYGDIHSAYVKSFQQRILFNVGSVGNSLDVTQASYGILEGVYDSSADDSFGIQLIRVPYAIEESIRDAAKLQMPDFDAYALELQTGRYRGAA